MGRYRVRWQVTPYSLVLYCDRHCRFGQRDDQGILDKRQADWMLWRLLKLTIKDVEIVPEEG
jgi:hypothetical protein